MLAMKHARKTSAGSAMRDCEEASGWKRDNGEGILSLEHYYTKGWFSFPSWTSSKKVGTYRLDITGTGCRCENDSLKPISERSPNSTTISLQVLRVSLFAALEAIEKNDFEANRYFIGEIHLVTYGKILRVNQRYVR